MKTPRLTKHELRDVMSNWIKMNDWIRKNKPDSQTIRTMYLLEAEKKEPRQMFLVKLMAKYKKTVGEDLEGQV